MRQGYSLSGIAVSMGKCVVTIHVCFAVVDKEITLRLTVSEVRQKFCAEALRTVPPGSLFRVVSSGATSEYLHTSTTYLSHIKLQCSQGNPAGAENGSDYFNRHGCVKDTNTTKNSRLGSGVEL